MSPTNDNFNAQSKIMRCVLLLFVAFNFAVQSFSQTLVMPGDHPDPSVVKIGDSYWASATTSNWMPAYPLLESKDLFNWTTRGTVFTQLPDWADYYFWAPEISYDSGKVYIYYSAHKKNGNLCVAVASADKPEGPYKDHGPLICQSVGSIDAFPMRDENGKLFIIWKEDGNSVKQPTPIWASQMNEERTALIGEKVELFRNDQPWEGNLVEGVSMIKRGEYYYAFYAAAGCCGKGCNYISGVARSKALLGPWEKYPNNPLLSDNPSWKCPGHGTPVEKNGKYYFLYHAYDPATNVYTGRQGVLKEFVFTEDNWIRFVDTDTTVARVVTKESMDEFDGKQLSIDWQWSVFQQPKYEIKKGILSLSGSMDSAGSMMAQKTLTGNYTATTRAIRSSAEAGIGLIGDEKNLIKATYSAGNVSVVRIKGGVVDTLAIHALDAKQLNLQMQVREGRFVSFNVSTNGVGYASLLNQPADAADLPPWDRALRVGLFARGKKGSTARYDYFVLANE
jgi:xylan 1,4-beta-xylosidase